MSHLITLDWKGRTIPFSLTAYGNLTEMCKAYGKRPKLFLDLDSTQNYIAALAADTGLPRTSGDFNWRPGRQLKNEEATPGPDSNCGDSPQLKPPGRLTAGGLKPLKEANPGYKKAHTLDFPDALLIIREGRYDSGTWAHPDIVMECARWLDPMFSIACNRTLRGILSGLLVHPATDKGSVLRRAARVEEFRQAFLRERELFRRCEIVEGNQTIVEFSDSNHIGLDKDQRSRLGQRLSHYSRCGKCIVGHTWVNHTDEGGYRRVATYPPEVLRAETRKLFGIEVQPILPPG
jgi:hypothetical protein